ncbi:hypothetical protein FACS189464_2690 [Bacteroidia bacterium]|nr:hypothetical protein FACS189464_2690 [Bacteroidia bacterium]
MIDNKTVIPEGWAEKQLGEILSYKQPYNYIVKSTEYSTNSGIPVLTAGKSFILGYTNESNDIYNDLPVIIFDDFTTDCKYVNFPFKVKSSAMKFLKSKEEVDIFFAFSHLQQLRLLDVGEHKRMWISEFSKIKIPLPKSLIEQRKIASILSKLDEAIAQTEQLIEKYKQIKTGLMHDLLTRGIDGQGNIRSEETHKFKDSPLGRIPIEWEVVKLGTIINDGGGLIQTGPFGSQLHANEYTEEGIPVIMPQNISQKGIDKKSLDVISRTKANILKRHATNIHDIIFARRGDLSKCAVIDNQFEGAICGTGCLLIRIKKVDINPFWLRLLYQQFNYQKEINISSVGSTMQNLNTEILSNLLIPKISRIEQNLIVKRIQGIDTLIEKCINNYNKLKLQKSGLMHDLLSGKVRINNQKIV